MTIAGKVTRKGQVTIPTEMRQALGLEVGDRVVFRLADGVVTIAPARSLVSKLAIGTGKRYVSTTDFAEEDDAVAAGFAEDEELLMEELGIEHPVH